LSWGKSCLLVLREMDAPACNDLRYVLHSTRNYRCYYYSTTTTIGPITTTAAAVSMMLMFINTYKLRTANSHTKLSDGVEQCHICAAERRIAYFSKERRHRYHTTDSCSLQTETFANCHFFTQLTIVKTRNTRRVQTSTEICVLSLALGRYSKPLKTSEIGPVTDLRKIT